MKRTPYICRKWEEAKYWNLCDMAEKVWKYIKDANTVLDKLANVQGIDEILDALDDDLMSAFDAHGRINNEIEYIKRKAK